MTKIKRILEDAVVKRMKTGKVMIIYGARRVGKTILLKDIYTRHKGHKLLLNGESSDVIEMFDKRTIDNYRRLFGGLSLLAVDEAQHIPDIGLKLKLLVDEVPNLRVIASGSSSFDLRNNAGEPLVGRSSQFMLTPLSLQELSAYESGFELNSKMDSRIIYGLYPELIELKTNDEKREYVTDIVNSYLLRDILAYDRLKDSGKLHDLLRLIAYQIGSEVSTEELGRQLKLSRNTVDRYLDLLQKVFVLFKVSGFSRNLRKEVTKSSKWYFQDTGIRNAVLRDFKPFEQRSPTEKGQLWENFIITERMKMALNQRMDKRFYFWRTYDNQEIDLVEDNGESLNAFEFKSGKAIPKIPKIFKETYPEAQFQVVNSQNYLDFLL